MLEYVKICPKCGHATPESSGDVCAAMGCGEFLGFVQPVPAAKTADKQQVAAPPVPDVHADKSPPTLPPEIPVQTHSHQVTTRFGAEPSLCLELPGTSKVYEIKNGWVIGQAHSTSNAHVQIADVPGANFIHRQHCSFDCVNGQWFVTAIPHEHYTNPTSVNNQKLQAAQRHPINNGDRLTMSNITFNVRIIKS